MRLSLATGTLANMNQAEDWKVKAYWNLFSLADFVTQLPCRWLWNTQGQAMPVIPVDNGATTKYTSEAIRGHPVPINWLEQCHFMALIYVDAYYEAKTNQYKYRVLRGGQAAATLSHWWWEMTLKNDLAVSHEVKHTPTLISSDSKIRYLPKRNENMCPRKYLYRKVHSSFIDNSKDWK